MAALKRSTNPEDGLAYQSLESMEAEYAALGDKIEVVKRLKLGESEAMVRDWELLSCRSCKIAKAYFEFSTEDKSGPRESVLCGGCAAGWKEYRLREGKAELRSKAPPFSPPYCLICESTQDLRMPSTSTKRGAEHVRCIACIKRNQAEFFE